MRNGKRKTGKSSNPRSKLYNSLKIIFLIAGIFLVGEGRAQIVYEDTTFPDVKIYEVTADIFADLVVYKAPNSIYTGINDNIGVWYFTSNPSSANVKVGYVSAAIFADLKVYYTTSNIFAHWNNDKKRKWFHSKLRNYNVTFNLNDSTKFEFVNPPKTIYVWE